MRKRSDASLKNLFVWTVSVSLQLLILNQARGEFGRAYQSPMGKKGSPPSKGQPLEIEMVDLSAKRKVREAAASLEVAGPAETEKRAGVLDRGEHQTNRDLVPGDPKDFHEKKSELRTVDKKKRAEVENAVKVLGPLFKAKVEAEEKARLKNLAVTPSLKGKARREAVKEAKKADKKARKASERVRKAVEKAA
jgi:hypothetical protein